MTYEPSQEKIRGKRGTIRALAGICRFNLQLFLTLDENGSLFELISHCEFSLKKYHFTSFTKSFSSTKLISTLSAILLRSLRTTHRG